MLKEDAVAIQIALAWNADCEKELKELGFEKMEVYVKTVATGATTARQVAAGDSAFFRMRNKPFQFVTTSWWGAGQE
jgi:hypothetical protein